MDRTAAMGQTSIDIAAPPETVWAVLSDADEYGEWVVGTKNVVHADDHWPRVGTHLEYELGVGPLTVGDRTVVLESEPPRLLVLRAELRRLGAALIRLALEAVDGGTRVVMDEDPVEGIIDTLHNPLSDEALKRRNDAALGRLKRLAEARA
jgi:uncharacterized protein YndB with AHSA1/START domain